MRELIFFWWNNSLYNTVLHFISDVAHMYNSPLCKVLCFVHYMALHVLAL